MGRDGSVQGVLSAGWLVGWDNGMDSACIINSSGEIND